MKDFTEKLLLLKLDFLKELFPDASFKLSDGCIDSDIVTLYPCHLKKIVESNLFFCIATRISTSTFYFV